MFDTPESRLILALDVAERREADRLVRETEGIVGVYKIGLEFALAGGLDLARELSAAGVSVFLDMKLLDIANTVAGAVRSAAALNVRFLTVHAYPQAIASAVSAAAPGLSIVAVTVLTSLNDADVAEAGYVDTAEALAHRRMAQVAALGAHAIVCSPREAAVAKRTGLAVITPGIRMATDAVGDQKRIATPQDAIAAGADAIVVGRPIHAADDVRGAAERFRDAIGEALH